MNQIQSVYTRIFSSADSSDGWMRRMKEDILSSLVKPINTHKAKNIIIFVGDGMGNPITVASRIYKGQLRGNPGEEEFLEFERFPHTGISKVTPISCKCI